MTVVFPALISWEPFIFYVEPRRGWVGFKVRGCRKNDFKGVEGGSRNIYKFYQNTKIAYLSFWKLEFFQGRKSSSSLLPMYKCPCPKGLDCKRGGLGAVFKRFVI